MAAVGIRELGRNPSKVVAEVESTRRPALIARHGKPVAAMVPIDDDALEDRIRSTAPEFAESTISTCGLCRERPRGCGCGSVTTGSCTATRRVTPWLVARVVHSSDLEAVQGLVTAS